MAFDIEKFEIFRKETYKNIDYRVVEVLGSGLLLAVKEDDVLKDNYPLIPVVIPEP